MNKTLVKFDQAAEQFAASTSFDVAIVRSDLAEVITSRRVQKTAAGVQNANGQTSVPLPADLFEVDGHLNDNFVGAVRANNDGGDGTFVYSEPFAVTWEPVPVSNVVFE